MIEQLSFQASEILGNALSTATAMGNKLMQARCHLLNQRIFTRMNDFEHAQESFETSQRLFQEADLMCAVCQLPIGCQSEEIQILTCTHLFHQR